MTEQLPDARLRDDVAQQIFTQALGQSEGLGDAAPAERKALLDSVAAISFEAAEAFVQARKTARDNRGT